jgi:shikimate 5-dehydrogenase/shikimate kinase
VKRVALIGHRGVGKTSLLARIENYYRASSTSRKVLCLDLDREIERRLQRAIHDIFAQDGEGAFRRIERETFEHISGEIRDSDRDVYVSLGAGFELQAIENFWHVIWVVRASDERGRIFTDRPRLQPDVSAFDEFQQRFTVRQPLYQARADQVLCLDEGLEKSDFAEKSFFTDGFRNLGGALTILPELLKSNERLRVFINERIAWGIRYFELRDDLLSTLQIENLLPLLPPERVLISFRNKALREKTQALVKAHKLTFDWPIEFASCPLAFQEHAILSLHAREEGASISAALANLSRAKPRYGILKAALPTRTFVELQEGHAWQMADPDGRVFLPMSHDGRWSWYRALRGNDLQLNFLREADGSAADQPTLLQWARTQSTLSSATGSLGVKKFAAILGDPVAHSRTPMEQRDFFAAVGVPVFAIRILKAEWRLALDFLKDLGLRWAAVTAPLKHAAFLSCQKCDALSAQLQAVNTLQWTEAQGWSGTNTDNEGFSAMLKKINQSLGVIAIWGGGGTLNMIRANLPDARAFSIRESKDRKSGEPAKLFLPETVIWAVGGDRATGHAPPTEWRPKLVIDLNYGADSLGREFAMSRGAKYISGLTMFEAQAAAQRRFWEISK